MLYAVSLFYRRSTPVNRSLQTSQLVEGSGQYGVESYGASLPALVMEALTFADSKLHFGLSYCCNILILMHQGKFAH